MNGARTLGNHVTRHLSAFCFLSRASPFIPVFRFIGITSPVTETI